MVKLISLFILFHLYFSFEYIYTRKNISNPLAKIPIYIGENQENLKYSEITIDLTYQYVLISPTLYYDQTIKDIRGSILYSRIYWL